MNIRTSSGIFIFLSAVASLHGAESERLQQICNNIVTISNNLCLFSVSASHVIENLTLMTTNAVASLTSIAVNFPKMTMLAAASGALYISWRSYQRYLYKQHLDDAKVFLHRDVQDYRIPVAGNDVLRRINLPLGNNPSLEMLNSYIGRAVELRNNLLQISSFNEWIPDLREVVQTFDDLTEAFTTEQKNHIATIINPRIASLGLPQYYSMLESPWVWLARIQAPWRQESNINPLLSYVRGVVDVYEGEATSLLWQLFEYEKELRARVAVRVREVPLN